MSRRRVEPAFLPAVLEIEETPPPVAARATTWSIVGVLLAALGWACVGEIEVVCVAPGVVIAAGGAKAVQSLETAVVRAIRVVEGQRVRAGETLIELDGTAARADRARLRSERAAVAADRARYRLLLDWLERGPRELSAIPLPRAEASAGLAPRSVLDAIQRRRLEQQYEEYTAALAALDAQADARRAEQRAAEARLAQLVATTPLLEEEVEANRRLATRGLAPRVHWLALERERLGARHEIEIERHRRAALEAALATIARERAGTAAAHRARWLGELAACETRLEAYDDELAKAERRVALQTLTAPVTGTVHRLAAQTVGGVVSAAAPLMLIVPDDAPLEVEASVANKDIGFVRAGQPAAIKVEAFDFTRYGTLAGRVRELSADAVATPDRARIYLARVALEARTLAVDGQPARLVPGMAVTVEITTGRRRVIEFLLSPLLRYRDEVARER